MMKEIRSLLENNVNVGIKVKDTGLPSDIDKSDVLDLKNKKIDLPEDNDTRELTEKERLDLKDTLGWSDEKIDKKCRIDENGVIHYKTDCQDLEGKTSANGILYKRRILDYKGIKIEGVFPKFDSKFDLKLQENDYQSSSSKQFAECNRKLKDAVEKEPELKDKFTKEELRDIDNGDTDISEFTVTKFRADGVDESVNNDARNGEGGIKASIDWVEIKNLNDNTFKTDTANKNFTGKINHTSSLNQTHIGNPLKSIIQLRLIYAKVQETFVNASNTLSMNS